MLLASLVVLLLAGSAAAREPPPEAAAAPRAFGPAARPAPAPPHPNSWSRSLIVVGGDGVHHFVRLQILSLLEVLPEVDPDGNRLVEPDELAAVRDQVGAYLADHYRVGPPGGEPWQAELVSVELLTHDADALGFEQLVDVERRFAVAPPDALAVEMTMFLDTSPRHFDLLDVRWPGGGAHETRLWAARTRETIHAPGPGGAGRPRESTWLRDLWLGAEHILYGIDHIAFLLALLVASTRVASLVGVVTAFTLSHSVTLTLAALDVVRLPDRPVEIVIAASIAYVGVVNLLRRQPRPLWIEAFVFGLVHGLGFASALGRLLPEGADRLRTLIVFNLGIELGQLALVLVAAGLLAVGRRLLRRRPGAGPPALAPAPVRTAVSVLVVLAGGWWLVERGLGL